MDTLKKSESDAAYGNAEKEIKQNSFKLKETIKIENTPFTLIKSEQIEGVERWYVHMGAYRISGEYKTEEEARKDGNRFDWDRIMEVIGIMIEAYTK